jgi:hypothetical protein
MDHRRPQFLLKMASQMDPANRIPLNIGQIENVGRQLAIGASKLLFKPFCFGNDLVTLEQSIT